MLPKELRDRLKIVPVRNFGAFCTSCGKWVRRGTPLWADLEGIPFEDYYCNDCLEDTEDQNGKTSKSVDASTVRGHRSGS